MNGILIAVLVILILVGAAIGLIFYFSPGLRSNFGQAFRRRFMSLRADSMKDIKNLSEQLTDTLVRLSKDKIGAIITIERKTPLDEYNEIGFQLSCKFSPELIFSIFYNKKSPLHDGAIIVRDFKITAVSCYFPTSNKSLDINYGARHRAALGVSETTDAVTYVVSESTGAISVAKSGKLTPLRENPEMLKGAIFQALVEVPSTPEGG